MDASDLKIQRMTELAREYEDCRRCGLCEKRINVVFGSGNVDADVMIIGEGPDGLDDQEGELFHPEGAAGINIDNFLKAMNVVRQDVWMDQIVMCRSTAPDDPTIDRPPNAIEMKACRERLEAVINIVDPKVILVLGRTALRLAKRWADHDDKDVQKLSDGITTTVQRADPSRLVIEIPGALRPVRYTAFAAFHPKYLLRLKEVDLNRDNSDLELSWNAWRLAFRVADSFNYFYEGTIPAPRGVDG